MICGYWVLMTPSQPTIVVPQAAFLFIFLALLHIITQKARAHKKEPVHLHTNLDAWTLLSYWFMALGERHIDKYLEYLAIEMVKLNWAELRQMWRSKLNKRSSLLADSTMVIRVSCVLPYIIYGHAVGCLQLNRPTVHWLGISLEAD